MSDNLPTSPGDPQVVLAALARAAAEIAARQAGARAAEPPGPAEIERIAEGAVRTAFLRIGVDLDDHKSVVAFNATLAHAERGRRTWEKAGSTIVTGIVTALVAGMLAVLGKVGLTGVLGK